MENDKYDRTVIKTETEDFDIYIVTGINAVFSVSFPKDTNLQMVYNTINSMASEEINE